MNFARPRHRGFTLLELLIVITIIAILSAALYPVFGYFRRKSKIMLAKNTMANITMAMSQYRQDFGAYPPDDTPSDNGSEMIAYYLARVHKTGEMHYGPYLRIPDNQLTDQQGMPATPTTDKKRFLSPLGGEYKYAVMLDKNGRQFSYTLVDPGEDKELGGTVNRTTGFSKDDQKLAADNIYNEAQVDKDN